MISYELEAQPLVIGMRDELNRQGYQVWMKVENDDRSLLESMTRGVELASVVIVAVTRKYKLTPYAFAGTPCFVCSQHYTLFRQGQSTLFYKTNIFTVVVT